MEASPRWCLQELQKNLGERRLTYYSACGVSVCPELDVDAIVGNSGVYFTNLQLSFLQWGFALGARHKLKAAWLEYMHCFKSNDCLDSSLGAVSAP